MTDNTRVFSDYDYNEFIKAHTNNIVVKLIRVVAQE